MVKGFPNWAVGLFGGLGVLVVGLGVFSLALRARDEGAEAERARARRAPRPPSSERTMTAAVVEQLAPPPGAGLANGEGSDTTRGDKAEALRPTRGRRANRPGAALGEAGQDQETEAGGDSRSAGETPQGAGQAAVVPEAVPSIPTTAPPPSAPATSLSLEEAERMQQQMESVLASLAPRIEDCARAADVSGEVEVRVAVNQDGSVKNSRLVGELDGSAAAPCILNLVKQTRYQRFQGPSIKLSHRFSVE